MNKPKGVNQHNYFIEHVRNEALALLWESGLGDTRITVNARLRTLKPEEAIGKPKRTDFPLLFGKESIVEAEVLGSRGHAFTGQPGDFAGTLSEIFSLDLAASPEDGGDWKRAIFIATLNAFLRKLGRVDDTVHCRDEEPEECASQLPDYMKERYGNPKIAIVGLQPAMVDHLRHHFELKVLDLDPGNVGQEKYGQTILHGRDDLEAAARWCDVILATGSSIVNNTMGDILAAAGEKPVVFYGVTVAGTAELISLERYCRCGH